MSQYNNPDIPPTPGRPLHSHTTSRIGSTSGIPANVDINAVGVVTPTDRVRWGPIWAGFLTTVTTWILLMLLGAALGLSLYDRGDNANSYRIGAAIWTAVASLLSFAFGGWMAARTAALQGARNGLINGFMVWALGIPVLLLLLTGGIGTALGLANRPEANVVKASVQQPTDDAGRPVMTDTQHRTATSTAWWTLLWLVLALLAAAGAGSAGASVDHDDRRRDVVATP